MGNMHAPRNERPRLVLLIDTDTATRHVAGPLLATCGLGLVQARESVAGLEILQRLPGRFRFAIISLEMPGLSGAVLIGTLRLFRPDLPLICLTAAAQVTTGGSSARCLAKPVQPDALRVQLADALEGAGAPVMDLADIRPEAVERARMSFARSRSLLEAAREVVRGMPGETAEGW